MPLSGEPRTLAVNPFIMRDNKKQDVPFWGIMLLKMWAGYRKLIGCVTTDWINNWGWIPSCATVPSTLLLVWHQFALISNSILLFSLFQQWGVCSIFPAAQSGAIYQHADTSKANPLRPKKKKGTRGALRLFAATNNLLWKQKESGKDWRTLPKDIFSFEHCVSFVCLCLWQDLNVSSSVSLPFRKHYGNFLQALPSQKSCPA